MTSMFLESDSDDCSFSSAKSSGEDVDLPSIASLSPTKRMKPEEKEEEEQTNPTLAPCSGQNPASVSGPSVIPLSSSSSFSFSTPTKQNRCLAAADGTKTPEGRLPSSATSGLLVPQNITAANPSYVSPLRSKGVSEAGNMREIRKAEKFTKEIRIKVEMNEKRAHYRKTGGVRAITKNWEEKNKMQSVSELSDRASETTPCDLSPLEMAAKITTSVSGEQEDDRPPFPVRAPGKPLFLREPQLITELYPPGFIEVNSSDKDAFSSIEQSMILQESPEELITAGWLQMIYQQKPCPLTIWQWLFHIMSKSSDIFICNGALRTLQSLVLAAQKRNDTSCIHPPYAEEVIDVLVELGADRSTLGQVAQSSSTIDTDDVFSGPKPPTANITCLLRYLSTCVKAVPSHYSTSDIDCLIVALLHMCLDPHLCGSLIETDVHNSIDSLVAAIPEENWSEEVVKIAKKIATLSNHHHNKFHLVLVFNGIATTERQRELQALICKLSIIELLEPKSRAQSSSDAGKPETQCTKVKESASPFLSTPAVQDSDVLLIRRVVQHFSDLEMERVDYYEMFSVMSILIKFMSLKHIQWAEGEKKRFAQDLTKLIDRKLRRDVNCLERGPVGDLIFRLRLDLGIQKDLAQQDIYFFMN